MPIVLLIVGIFLAIAGIKNNAATVGTVLRDDFSGAGSFWYWVVAVIIIGSVGYYSKAETVSRLFLVLIVLVFALSNQGIYAQLVGALENPQSAPGNDIALDTDKKPAPAEGEETPSDAPAPEGATGPGSANPFDIFGGIGKDLATSLFPGASMLKGLFGL